MSCFQRKLQGKVKWCISREGICEAVFGKMKYSGVKGEGAGETGKKCIDHFLSPTVGFSASFLHISWDLSILSFKRCWCGTVYGCAEGVWEVLVVTCFFNYTCWTDVPSHPASLHCFPGRGLGAGWVDTLVPSQQLNMTVLRSAWDLQRITSMQAANL